MEGMKCGNCNSMALFEYRLTRKVSQFYCGKHLPKFLDSRRRAGLLTITDQHDAEKKSALELLSVKLPEPTLVVEEAPAPAAPKRKRKPKKNEVNS